MSYVVASKPRLPKQTASTVLFNGLKLLIICCLPLLLSATPIGNEFSQFVVAIDIGHSPSAQGATSARGVKEYHFNKNLAEMLLQNLHAAGMTQAFIVTANDPDMPLFIRASLANTRNAHLFVSLHHDSAQAHYLSDWVYQGKKLRYTDRFKGYSLFVSTRNGDFEGSYRAAELLGQSLSNAAFAPTYHHAEPIPGENRPLLDKNLGIYQYDGLAVLSNTRMPAVLIESGVIVNRDEEILLSNPVYQRALTEAFSQAIRAYAQQHQAQESD